MTPVGRITNRFASDLQTIDVQLRQATQVFFMSSFQAVGAIAAMSISSPLVLAAVLPVFVVYLRVARHYRASSRELRRLESMSSSPIYAALDEALAGARRPSSSATTIKIRQGSPPARRNCPLPPNP